MDAVLIGDTQIKDGVPIDHIVAAGKYLLDHKPDHIIVMGDWWDMPSLSRFNSNLEAEGLKLLKDLEAGNKAMETLLKPINDYNAKRKLQKKKTYNPKLIFIVGNHDPQVRLERLVSEHPILEGFVKEDTTAFLQDLGFTVVPFLGIHVLEDIRISHYFQNPWSLKGTPLSGNAETMLKNAGFSFICGHQQVYKTATQVLSDGTMRIGIVIGAFYMHDESFMQEQGNKHWRGIAHLRNIKDGGADIQGIHLNNLLEMYK